MLPLWVELTTVPGIRCSTDNKLWQYSLTLETYTVVLQSPFPCLLYNDTSHLLLNRQKNSSLWSLSLYFSSQKCMLSRTYFIHTRLDVKKWHDLTDTLWCFWRCFSPFRRPSCCCCCWRRRRWWWCWLEDAAQGRYHFQRSIYFVPLSLTLPTTTTTTTAAVSILKTITHSLYLTLSLFLFKT